ncbi:uncharacterized protein C1orf198 homolog [Dipodomys spectabilis]|uniref:uncharacterized protein C1orf198 homolog n=1 Tax=Dipodomys spectabilis TaxID=105255 RepID=UPI001C5345C7|nr:uncharacterized protein C1orf198 homolog [Dipodomys spectabilis]
MASMAAAIAASRAAVMSGSRPLDERERKRFTYFSSLSPMARKIMQDKERVREQYGPEWARLPPARQDELIDRCLLGPRAPPAPAGRPGRFPGPGPTGQKVVRFGDEDITWQDEHSAPFSWETRSQMEFSISSLSIQEPSAGVSVSEPPRPPAKASQGTPGLRPPQGSRSSSLDALGPSRKDEEAAFWKVNAERSREGPEAQFQSLTPSQIKSMEKAEKASPASCWQEPAPKDREAKAAHREQVPPSTEGEQERPQAVPAPADPEPGRKLPALGAGLEDEDRLFLEPTLSQVSSSTVVLKTGFDFLDNW